jgi:hypothetical protein
VEVTAFEIDDDDEGDDEEDDDENSLITYIPELGRRRL